jgi:hypothetical protein
MPIRLTVRLGTTPEAMSLDHTGESTPPRGADHIHPVTHLENIDLNTLPFLDIYLPQAKLSQVTHRGQSIAF